MNLSLKNFWGTLKNKFKGQQKLKVDEVTTRSILTTKNQDELLQDYSDQAHSFLEQDNYPKAIECFRKIISINPNVADHYRNLGYALTHKNSYWYNPQLKETLINQGHIDEAIACYQKAIALGFHDYYYWTCIFLGDALTTRVRIEEASKSYQEAVCCKIRQTKPTFVPENWDYTPISGPQFLVIGVAKCGTSSLYEYMIQHPQILSAAKKEIDFGDHIDNGIDWYLSHFSPTPKDFITGEASTSYFGNLEAREFFKERFPQCKLIVILRNPVDRFISHYYNDVKYSGEKRPLAELANDELKMFEGISSLDDVHQTNYWKKQRGYLFIGIYVYFLRLWMSHFPKEQLLVLNSEKFFTNPASTLTTVFNFLELPDYKLSQYRPHNQGSYLKKDSSTEEQQVRTKLSKFFEPYNRELEDYLGIKFNWN
jgi:hypothetical protein